MGAFALAGCSAPDSATEETARRSPSATDRARARAARDSEALAARYDTVIAALPGLAERLAPLRAEVARHVGAFGGKVPAADDGGSPSPSAGSASTPASSSPSPSPAPADGPTALAGLAEQERLLADRRMKALLDVPGELARLLASVAASGAAHAYLLAQAQREESEK